MENNELCNNEKSLEQQSKVETINDTICINGDQNEQTLTNDQKLEYISKLILNVEHDLEENEISKKLLKNKTTKI